MKNELKAQFFFDIQNSPAFQAQIMLETEQYETLQKRFLTLDPHSNVNFEYARIRGSLEALNSLKAIREKLIEDHRSRLRNS